MPESPPNGNDRSERPGKKLPQFIVLPLATLAAFSIGTHLSWTSAALPLHIEESTLLANNDEGSWTAASLPFGAVVGTLSAENIAEKLGRKKSIWFMTLSLFFSWFIIAFMDSLIWMYVGRFAAGVACGVVSIVIPMYVSEIADANMRGSIGTIFQLQITLGILFAYATGFTGNLLHIATLCSVIPGFLLMAFPFMPESPEWLIGKGRRKEADYALRRLRGRDYQTEETLTRLQEDRRCRGDRISIFDLKYYSKATIITLGLAFFQQLSGISVLIFYAQMIFEDGETTFAPVTSAVIVGIAQAFVTSISTMVTDRAGRKILLFISISAMAVCMFVLSAYFRFKCERDVSAFAWIPILVFIGYVVVYAVGFGPIPWLMVSELFPNNAYSTANTLAGIVNWMVAFLVTKCFRNMVDLMGLSSSFATFGIICLVGSLFVAIVVPETKDKIFEEVQMELYGLREQEFDNSKLER